MSLKISVIIPTYNEKESVASVIDGLKNVLANNDYENEIIVVDDASTDNTAEIVRNKDVRLLQHETNRGYGAALKYGIDNASYDIIVIIDADGTYRPEDLPMLLEAIKEYDMVVGARTGEISRIPLVRKPAKWILNRLADYLTETKIPDLNSGLRVFKKEKVQKFFPILPSGFSFTTTITLSMLTNNYSVKYIPVHYLKREGKSKIRPVRDTINFIQLIIRTIIYFDPLKVFLPVSLFLLFASVAILFYSFFYTPKVMDITTIVLFVSSIHMLGIGMIADLIVKKDKL